MAIDPNATSITLSYEGGTATAPLGVLEALFGTLQFQWLAPIGEPGPSGRRRLKYGRRQRSRAKAGKPVSVRLNSGDVWTVRVTGADIDFLDKLLTQSGANVAAVWTPRGTIYAPQFVTV